MAPASYDRFGALGRAPCGCSAAALCAWSGVCIYVCVFVYVYVYVFMCVCVRCVCALCVCVRVVFARARVCACAWVRARVGREHARAHNLLPSLVLTTPRRRCRFFDQYQQYQESRDPPRDALGPQIGALDHRYSSASTSARSIEVIRAAGNRLGPPVSCWDFASHATCSPRVLLL